MVGLLIYKTSSVMEIRNEADHNYRDNVSVRRVEDITEAPWGTNDTVTDR
jgi:hypothetical protein